MTKSNKIIKLKVLDIFKIYFKAGLLSFGGWSATALNLEEDLVKNRKLLTLQDIKEATTFAQIIPGATQVAIVANTSYKLSGINSALIAVVAYILPAISIVTLFSFLYFNYNLSIVISGKLQGLVAGLSGIIIANAFKIANKHITKITNWILPVIAVFCVLLIHLHPLIILICSGLLGIFISKLTKVSINS